MRAVILEAIAPWRGRLVFGEDDFGNPKVFTRRDMFHLDADALNDRLHAWIARSVADRVPGASAFVSFRNAVTVKPDDPELDFEEEWTDLEPTLRLESEFPEPGRAEVEAFVTLFTEFLALVDGSGRPVGYRDPEHGNTE